MMKLQNLRTLIVTTNNTAATQIFDAALLVSLSYFGGVALRTNIVTSPLPTKIRPIANTAGFLPFLIGQFSHYSYPCVANMKVHCYTDMCIVSHSLHCCNKETGEIMGKTHFDRRTFYAALNAQREAKHLSWRDVAKETGISASTLTRIGQGKQPDMDNFISLMAWLGLEIGTFFSTQEASKTETLTVISSCLHHDPRLTHDAASLIDSIVQAAYERLST